MDILIILSFIFFEVSLGESLQNETESERIINGAFAEKNMFPWMVALFYNDEFVCTASLISPQHVLTAGHCVVFNRVLARAEDYYGVIGSVSKSKGQKIRFSKITAHPQYDNLFNDLAILKIEEKVTLSDSVQPICLATKKIPCVTLKPVTAMGWGITTRDTDSTETSDRLKYTKLRVYPNLKCSVLYGNKISDTILCAGALNTGICSGDSGGPLVMKVDKKKQVQVGVAGFANDLFGCGRVLGPGGFTRIASYTDFIRQAAEGAPCFV